MTNRNEIVLVTGGSGFIALYCIIKLLREGYKVRTTVRNLSRKNDILKSIRNSGLAVGDNEIEFYEADLSLDNGWSDAVKGVTYIMHVASPFPAAEPENEDDLINPAKEGTLRVLKAAYQNGNIKRVVLTSSFAAIGYGRSESLNRPFNEDDWTVPNNSCGAYVKSKYYAEKAAWEFVEKETKNQLELSVINPVGVFGPLLDKQLSTSIQFVKSIIGNEFNETGYPQFDFGVVDVRDVADIHYLAMIKPEANGQRFLATNNGFITLDYMANVILNNLSDQLPNKLIIPPSSSSSQTNSIRFDAVNDKAKKLLGWNPISTDDAIIESAKSLINLQLV